VKLARDLIELERLVEGVEDVHLIIINPLTSYLGGVDSHKNADIRGVLEPLDALAARHGVTLVTNNHLDEAHRLAS
jgi:hypothetical protein